MNYRSLTCKYDGNRPLAVQVRWSIKNGKLSHELSFDKPFELNGNDIFNELSDCMQRLSLRSTDDINKYNADMTIVYSKEKGAQ